MVIADVNDSRLSVLVVSAEIIVSARGREIRRRESRVAVAADIRVLGELVSIEPASGHGIRGRVALVMEEDVSDVLREEDPQIFARRNRGVLPPEEGFPLGRAVVESDPRLKISPVVTERDSDRAEHPVKYVV